MNFNKQKQTIGNQKKNTLQYVKHEVQTSLVEETDLKTKKNNEDVVLW